MNDVDPKQDRTPRLEELPEKQREPEPEPRSHIAFWVSLFSMCRVEKRPLTQAA